MRTELTRFTRTGLVLCSLAALSTVFVAGCSEPSTPEPAPTSSPADGGGGGAAPDSDGSSTQGGGGGSSSQ